MKILFCASECLPFIKTGGLADVVGTLPRALIERDPSVEVRVMIPKYRSIPEQTRYSMRHVFDTRISLGWRNQFLGVDELTVDGVTYWFIDNEFYFGGDYIYGSGDFETERFCFFCKAVLESLRRLDFMPDIIHCNDWQTGYVPLLVKQYGKSPEYAGIKTVFTIHNLKFQGIGNRGLVADLLSLGDGPLNSIEYSGCVSAMKAGVKYCDRITTVSPTYAREIMTPEYGETMDLDLRLRANDVTGILNGISNRLFDPSNDRSIPMAFDKDSLVGKAACKEALINELGLERNYDKPLFAVISRLTDQKGMDKVRAILPKLLWEGSQAVILGMGDEDYEGYFNWLQRESPNFAFRREMNDALARRIYAGADLFLMPSAFEPCGLSQMLALRYGCIPIVRETGGLADTVMPYNKFEDTGNGFSFSGKSFASFSEVVGIALSVYYDKPAWERLVKRAMETDFDWRVSAGKYLEMYGEIIK
ncbi:MAG: glycogen synthase [Clostridiales bacterium]|nr:glycogen synthase [Clostridiales bacterium]